MVVTEACSFLKLIFYWTLLSEISYYMCPNTTRRYCGPAMLSCSTSTTPLLNPKVAIISLPKIQRQSVKQRKSGNGGEVQLLPSPERDGLAF